MGGTVRANEMFLDWVGRGHVATGSRAESVSQPIARVAGYKEAHTYSLTVTWLRDSVCITIPKSRRCLERASFW